MRGKEERTEQKKPDRPSRFIKSTDTPTSSSTPAVMRMSVLRRVPFDRVGMASERLAASAELAKSDLELAGRSAWKAT